MPCTPCFSRITNENGENFDVLDTAMLNNILQHGLGVDNLAYTQYDARHVIFPRAVAFVLTYKKYVLYITTTLPLSMVHILVCK